MATQVSLEPSALSAFVATLSALPSEEVRKAKSLFIRNAIADYQLTLKTTKGFLIVLGVMSIIPVFLIVFIPSFIAYRAARVNARQKIQNALEVWKDDLGDEAPVLLEMLQAI